MKATFKNLGAIKDATLDVGDFTILTGRNNTGKTYATYAIYGFLRSWRDIRVHSQRSGKLGQALLADNEVAIDLNDKEQQEFPAQFLRRSAHMFSRALGRLFASDESDNRFKDAVFELGLPNIELDQNEDFILSKRGFVATRDKGNATLFVKRNSEGTIRRVPLQGNFAASMLLDELIAESFLGHLLPRPVILTSERTGISLFWRELDTQKNVLVDKLKNMGSEKINVHQLVSEMSARYARPIQDNIDTTRNFPLLFKETSYLASKHPEVLEAFAILAGGSYKVGVGKEPHFAPNAKAKRKGSIPLYLGSSSVRSLMSLGSYLQHEARRGDLLMIDEPELNLHPEGQRQLGRVLALLVNAGVKVFVTTHSDYLVREVNTLVKLNGDFPNKTKLLKKLRYNTAECLKPSQVKLYVAENSTLSPVGVAEGGFSRSTFDEVLTEMSKVEDTLMLAKEGLADA